MGGVIKTEFRAHFTAGHHLPTLFCHHIKTNLKALLLSRNESNQDFLLIKIKLNLKSAMIIWTILKIMDSVKYLHRFLDSSNTVMGFFDIKFIIGPMTLL